MSGETGILSIERPATFRQGGDIRDTLKFYSDANRQTALDLSTLTDLEYRLKLAGGTAVVRKKSQSADRSFPDAGVGADGRITFIILQAVVDALPTGTYEVEIVSVSGSIRIPEAAGRITIEATTTA